MKKLYFIAHHEKSYFGQDYTIQTFAEKQSIQFIYINSSNIEYNFQSSDIVISRYPDNELDVNFIYRNCKLCSVIIHLHLNYEFLSTQQKRNLEKAIRCASKVVANSEYLKTQYLKIFPNINILVVANGIDISFFHYQKLQERVAFRNKFNILSDKTLISYIGRISNAKGAQILERILIHYTDSQNIHFLIQYIYHPKYEQILLDWQHRFKNCTFLYNEKNFVGYCDLNICTSLSETTSLTTMESLFTGTPVIANNCTPFYNELLLLVGDNYLKILDVINYTNFITLEKNNLTLRDHEAEVAANEFIKKIDSFYILSEEERELLSIQMRYSKYNSEIMLKQLFDLYC